MKTDENLKRHLWTQFIGNVVVYGGSLVLLLLLAFVNNKRELDSDSVLAELIRFEAMQPNYADSLRIYDAQNAENIQHLTHVVDFLTTHPMPSVNRDSLVRELNSVLAQRQKYIDEQARVDSLMQHHLDSVRNKNKYNIFVRRAAMRYSK